MKRYDIDRIDNRTPETVERFVALFEPGLWSYFRPVVRGLERIPDGAALYVGNHSAGLLTPDTFIFGIALYRRLGLAAVPFGLGHEVAIRLPGIHQLLVPLGAVRASHENAHRLFAAGRKVVVYPGSDYDSFRRFSDRHKVVFGPRRGYVRLALRAGVPIVPVVTAGSHSTFVVLGRLDGAFRGLRSRLGIDRLLRLKVWPVTLSLPWGLTIGPTPPHLPLPTRIFIEALDPIRFERCGEEAAADPAYVEVCHHRVLELMQSAMSRLAAERRGLGWRRWTPFLP